MEANEAGLMTGVPMKILFLSNLYPTPAEPTRGTFNAQLAAHMAAFNEVTVMVPLPWFPRGSWARRLFPAHSKQYGDIPSVLVRDGLQVHYPRYPVIPGRMDSVHSEAMQLGIAGLIRRLHRRLSFDVINAHWLYPDGIVAARVGQLLNIPVMLTALGSDVNSMLAHPTRGRQIVEATRQAALVSVVAPQLGEVLARRGVDPGKIVTIANGVDTVRFHPRDRAACRRELAIPPDEQVIVCVARLSAEKGIAVLIAAMKEVVIHFPRARLHVCGEGAQRAELERLRAELGVVDAVKFEGAVPYDKIPTWWGAADLGCLPSFREGHPNALMEALASGVPMVASRVGSVPDYLCDSNGLIVEPGDANALATALKCAMSRAWDANCIAASVGTRSWRIVAREYVDALQALVQAAP